jgi:selenocysteine-specific elongation factor
MLNINLGLLGHVDSGKTSLSRLLSSSLSTASLDRSRESRERGITLDLGFSSFEVPVELLDPALHAEHLRALAELSPRPPGLQYTVVDHPGHSSLLRTMILGQQIIDCSVLVVDAVAGVQPQTVEASVLGDVVLGGRGRGLVVVNKCDVLEGGVEDERYARARARARVSERGGG